MQVCKLRTKSPARAAPGSPAEHATVREGVGKYLPHPLVIFRIIGRNATGEALLEAVTETNRKHVLHFEVFWFIFYIHFEIFLRQSALNVRISYHVSFGFVLSMDMVKVRSTKGQLSQNPKMAV